MMTIKLCGINQLHYEAYDDDMPGIVGLALTEEGARANFAKCREDLNYRAIREMMDMEAEEDES